jgi:PelA/Pel-15E family pectate lyase
MPFKTARTAALSRRSLLCSAAAGLCARPAAAVEVRWSATLLEQPAEWYASAEARAIAESVIQYQSALGAWPKNTNLAVPPSPQSLLGVAADGRANTIDNGATTTPMRFLARVVQVTGDPKYSAAFLRGIDYLLAAQYPNGGWPQFFPLRNGYYSHITYNDDAMVNVMTLLRDVSAGKSPYEFVHPDRRAKTATAGAKGIACVLRTQVRQDGELTAWCAQHDAKTLAPAWARAYEPPSLSGAETVQLVRFLMQIDRPTPQIAAAVEGAVAWLKRAAVRGLRVEDIVAADGKRDRRAVADATAPPLLARFYELGTNRPIFLGRDSIVRYDFNEIERERRTGYSYLGSWPADLLTKELPRWRERHIR